MAKARSVTVLGLGNTLLGDEGFGVHFVRWIDRRYCFPKSVRLVDGGTLGYRLLDELCSCDYLIVVDVIKIDDVPGAVYRFTRHELEQRLPPPTSAHEVEFPDVLTMAELLGQVPEVVFLCIVPQRIGQMVVELTPCMQERFPALEKLLLDELAVYGVAPQLRTAYA